jgi:hypothetical protein
LSNQTESRGIQKRILLARTLALAMAAALTPWAIAQESATPTNPASPTQGATVQQETQLVPNPEDAKKTRAVAAANRRRANQIMDINRASSEPLKTAAREEAEAFENLVKALEDLANAQEIGDNAKVIELNKKQLALVQKALIAGDKTEAAREESLMRSTVPVDNLRRIAEPASAPQIDMLASLRTRAGDAWARYRRSFSESADGRGSNTDRIEAPKMSLDAIRHEKVMRLKILASRLENQIPKSDTPDLLRRLVSDLQRMAKELDTNLTQQTELRIKELDLEIKHRRMEDEARSMLR